MKDIVARALRWPIRVALNTYLAVSEYFCPVCRSSQYVSNFTATSNPAERPAKFCSHCNHLWPTHRV